ncbi:MAG: cell division protein FtsB [Gammaproteobacteria bacterium]|nr:cell division protein FtsB [Gammaproteobacteria bacterium]
MKILLAILVFLFLALQYALWFGESSLPQSWTLREQVQEQKTENAKLIQRNKTLEAEVLDLKRGKDAIEERARSELGMIKKGETFYHIIEEDKKDE